MYNSPHNVIFSNSSRIELGQYLVADSSATIDQRWTSDDVEYSRGLSSVARPPDEAQN